FGADFGPFCSVLCWFLLLLCCFLLILGWFWADFGSLWSVFVTFGLTLSLFPRSCPHPGVAGALRSLWAKEPVIAASFGIAALALLSPLLSPYSKYSGMINQATPYAYPGTEPRKQPGISLKTARNSPENTLNWCQNVPKSTLK
ncbi:NADH dehydrogenase [ubiquinone] 1 alpha subcomplex subunit 3, partial [Onychostruthus taczanowskii]|uniref:NADH dehydrogenase [ubiquinone] 1 alpha subcomplex subunit 3 n=1 Tax=Onychostruthus taczanowskii TaxID=356909 RepID=UPI001B8029DD